MQIKEDNNLLRLDLEEWLGLLQPLTPSDYEECTWKNKLERIRILKDYMFCIILRF